MVIPRYNCSPDIFSYIFNENVPLMAQHDTHHNLTIITIITIHTTSISISITIFKLHNENQVLEVSLYYTEIYEYDKYMYSHFHIWL